MMNLYLQCVDISMVVLAILMMIMTLDDAIIDILYWYKNRRPSYHSSLPPYLMSTIQEHTPLHQVKQRPIAIMVPAWQESDVIANMLRQVCTQLNYPHYQVFVGTYPNDTATIAEVERMQQHYPQIQRIELPHHGPSCKADCLNYLYLGIQTFMQTHHMTFVAYVLHDAEDVVHPEELALFNLLLDDYDLIQIPVRAIEQKLSALIAGTYIDEFAEWHTKDLIVRSQLTHITPSAGVGTCFSRQALIAVTPSGQQSPFNTDSVTEDYDISLRIGLLGLPSTFVLYNVPYHHKKRTWFGWGSEKHIIKYQPLAVQEYFPHTLKTAYRQKARWILGIGLQGWQNIGWQGRFLSRYFLYRDRKALIAPFIHIASYLLMLEIITLSYFTPLTFNSLYHPPAWLNLIYSIVFVIFIAKLVQRAYFVGRLYGYIHAIITLPRMIVNNVINFMAVVRAWRQFMHYLYTKKTITWDKTTHQYPNLASVHQPQHLLELIESQQLITSKQRHSLTETMGNNTALLVDYLYQQSWIDDKQLKQAVAYQTGLPLAYLNQNAIQPRFDLIKQSLCLEYQIVPFALKDNHHVCIATSYALPPTLIKALSMKTGYTLEQFIDSLHVIKALLQAPSQPITSQ